MSPTVQFRVAARLGLATTVVMLGLMVLGSVVRTTGSGLACPDWPLCEGRLIPRFEFHVMIEWLHRLAALIVSLMLAATAAWVALHAPVRARLGGLAGLAVGLLAVQVLLGALTVWKLLDPAIVGGHLGVALLLFCTVLLLALAANAEASPGEVRPHRPAGLLPLLCLATAATYAQSLLGGIVASHHAGLACPDWPGCYGELFPPLAGKVGLQMLHRYGAYLVTALLIVVAIRARLAPDPVVRAGAPLAFGLVIAQVALGVITVTLAAPPLMVAAHLGTATSLLGVMVATTFRVATAPAAERVVAVPAAG